MKVTTLESINPGNPFHSDAVHMGTYIGKNCAVMMLNHAHQECKYIIVVDMETGERIRVDLK